MASCNMCRNGLTALKRPCPNGCKPEGFKPEGEPVWIDYTNWRGERGWRQIYPHSLKFEATSFHPEPQWMLHAYAIDRFANRTFAMADIHAWSTKAPA